MIVLQDRLFRNEIEKSCQTGAVFNLSPKYALKMMQCFHSRRLSLVTGFEYRSRIHWLIAALMDCVPE
jgi:hypothetical protein